MKNKSYSFPPRLECQYNSFRQRLYTINIDICESDDGMYVYDSITIPPEKFNREGIISTLVDYKYPRQEMDAIINNYLQTLSGVDKKKYIDEMQQMQAYRDWAKKFADELLKSL